MALLLAGCVPRAEEAGGQAAAAPGPEPASGQVRRYFVAAEEVDWDYAPSGMNRIKPGMGMAPWGDVSVYRKTRYFEYTDESFSERKPQPAHLGILGPVLRAAVGDTLEVHFLNRGRRPFSMHPHGVFYAKDDEGAAYGGIAGKGASVAPGERYVYTWEVPERAGPGPEDASSVIWMYHSHVDSVADVFAGLVGPIVITAAAEATADARPRDVDRELFAFFMVFDENAEDEENEGDLLHAINGYIFGNLPELTATEGERVRWYLMALGNEVDLHTPHWHGVTVLHEGRRKDVIELLPASMTSADMVADAPGTWLFHCHVTDHISAGMLALFEVEPR